MTKPNNQTTKGDTHETKTILAAALVSAVAVTTTHAQTVTDAYVYLLGRAIVIRQEQTDIKESFCWKDSRQAGVTSNRSFQEGSITVQKEP